MSTAKTSAIDTASSLHGSLGSSLISSDGSEFPVQEVLGRYARLAHPHREAHVLTWLLLARQQAISNRESKLVCIVSLPSPLPTLGQDLARRAASRGPDIPPSLLPIDDKEAQREYFMHRGLKEYFKGHLHHSPIQNPQRIAVSGHHRVPTWPTKLYKKLADSVPKGYGLWLRLSRRRAYVYPTETLQLRKPILLTREFHDRQLRSSIPTVKSQAWIKLPKSTNMSRTT